jgi:hypothetical protein
MINTCELVVLPASFVEQRKCEQQLAEIKLFLERHGRIFLFLPPHKACKNRFVSWGKDFQAFGLIW